MKGSTFLNRNDPIFIADTCLLSLTCMSYLIPQRDDLIAIFEETISLNIQTLLKRNPIPSSEVDIKEAAKAVVLRNRLGLLLGYYADMLFTNDVEAFRQVL